jgi:hypothetical protein
MPISGTGAHRRSRYNGYSNARAGKWQLLNRVVWRIFSWGGEYTQDAMLVNSRTERLFRESEQRLHNQGLRTVLGGLPRTLFSQLAMLVS